MTNTLNPRYRSIVSGAWTEFVLMVKDVRPRDSGTYECQVILMKIVTSPIHCCEQATFRFFTQPTMPHKDDDDDDDDYHYLVRCPGQNTSVSTAFCALL